jgi:AcrR family transcriptional regulator
MSKAEKTRQFIIEKTAPIFNTKGFAGTSLSDMTEATGLTKGSIYGNFADKDEVALAAFDFNVRRVAGLVRAEMDKYASYRDKLMVYIEIYGNSGKFPLFVGGCPIMNTITEADDTHPRLKQKAGEALVYWKERIQTTVQAGIEAGEFKSPVNTEEAALTIISLLEGGILFAKATGKPHYRKLIVNSAENFIKGL